MKIALLADIHGFVDNLREALEEIAQSDASVIFCLGDIVTREATEMLAKSPLPVYAVFGNNDLDRRLFQKMADRSGGRLEFLGESGEVELEGKKYFLAHYPRLAESVATFGNFDAAFHGHTHFPRREEIGRCIVANPGEVAGYRSGRATFAFYDTDTRRLDVRRIRSAQ
jgi:putative phosphoesterase